MFKTFVDEGSKTPPRNAERHADANVFISYSRQDLAFVDMLQAALRQRGIEAAVDRDSIEKGEAWWARIQQLIIACDTIVFVLSPASVSSEVCQREVDFAQSLNKRFLPVVAREIGGLKIPDALARLNYIFFTANSRTGSSGEFDDAIDQLVRAIEIDITWIREHTRLGMLAERWEARGRANDLLLRGIELLASEIWLTTQPKYAPDPTDSHLALIRTSRLATTRRRRTAIGLSVSALALAAAVVALTYTGFLDPEYIEGQVNGIRNSFHEAKLVPGDVVKECADICPDMVLVPPGDFLMGSPADEKGRDENEGPQHRVTIRQPLLVSRFEVTFSQWDACHDAGGCSFRPPDRGWNETDVTWGRGKRAVVNVSFNDVQQYVAWLSKKTGTDYRLLSEAEWEYSARAGGTSRFHFGDDEVNLDKYAWYAANADGRPQPVGGKAPNAFGLFDMHGNVSEWVADVWHASYDGAPEDGSAWMLGGDPKYRVMRGGSWSGFPQFQRSAARDRSEVGTDLRGTNMGFRVGRTVGSAGE